MTSTRDKILDLSADFTRRVGFNGFSYLDLAEGIGVKHTGIHYHFKAKSDLAIALVEHIRQTNSEIRSSFDTEFEDPRLRLCAVITYFSQYHKGGKFCMCGMMAAELAAFGPDVRASLRAYFQEFAEWLAVQFALLGHPKPQTSAFQFISGLEGALLLARLEGDAEVVHKALERFTA